MGVHAWRSPQEWHPQQRTGPWGREVASIQRQEKGSSYMGAEDDRQSDKMRTQEITEHQERRLVSQADWPQHTHGQYPLIMRGTR
jgi:hypothetical protein